MNYLEFLRLNDKEKVRHALKDDFERLTAQPVVLDDLCMLLIEKYREINHELREMAAGQDPETFQAMEPDLSVRKRQIVDELAMISALILRYPEAPWQREARAHIQLDWAALYWVAFMPLDNRQPAKGIAVHKFINALIDQINALITLESGLT